MHIVYLLLKVLFLLIVAILVIGFAYEQYARYKAKSYQETGTFVDVGGYKLHYLKEGKGNPVVVFEAGLDPRGYLVWNKVQKEVSKFATTISYDRAGILKSQRGNKAKSSENIAKDLHLLLEKIEIKKPYILVAHSMGGLSTRSYIKEFGDEVAGIIFVDANNPDILKKAPEELKKYFQINPPSLWLTKLFLNIGLTRVMVNNALNIDKEFLPEINAYLQNTTFGNRDEMAGYNMMLNDAKNISFGDKPYTVIAATKAENEIHKKVIKVISEVHEESLRLSTKSKIIWADNSGHNVHLEHPEIVINAISSMIREFR